MEFTYSMIGANQFLKAYKTKIGALTVIEKSVFGDLCNFANKDGICYPKVATIAENLNCSVRSVQKAFITLLNKGLMTRTAQFSQKSGLQRHNIYTINLDATLMDEIAYLNKIQMQKEKERFEYQKKKNSIIKKRIEEKEQRLLEEKKARKAFLRQEILKLKVKHQRGIKKALQAKIKLMTMLWVIKEYIDDVKIKNLLLEYPDIRKYEFPKNYITEINSKTFTNQIIDNITGIVCPKTLTEKMTNKIGKLFYKGFFRKTLCSLGSFCDFIYKNRCNYKNVRISKFNQSSYHAFNSPLEKNIAYSKRKTTQKEKYITHFKN